MKIEKLGHIGITVKNADEALKFYTDVMGVKKSDIAVESNPAVKIATIKLPGGMIELLQFLDPADPTLKYANPKGDAIHHMAINVDNIVETLAVIKKQGGTLVHEKPMVLPSGRKVAFAMPKNSQVLIEFMED